MRHSIHTFFLAGLCLLGALAPARATAADSENAQAGRKTAIFVNNLGGEKLAAEAPVLEAALAAELNGRGFSVLSAQEIAESIRKSGKQGEDLGQQLASDSSARALARTLGADYLLVAHLMSYNKRQAQYQGNGIRTVNDRYRLRVGYGLLESAQGSGLIGETFVIETTERESDGLKINDEGRLADMVAEAAVKIANDAVAKAEAGKIAAAPKQAQEVTFTVSARLQGIALPNIGIDDNGRANFSAETFPVEAMGATVELDGVVIGSAPGTFRALPGLHQMRVTRPGFETWARNVNIYEGFQLTAALEFTPEGLAHWKNMSKFLQDLKSDAQLSAAQVDLIQGAAQALRQSGYRVDTKDAPANIFQYGSIWEPVVVPQGRIQRGVGPVIIPQQNAQPDAPKGNTPQQSAVPQKGALPEDSAAPKTNRSSPAGSAPQSNNAAPATGSAADKGVALSIREDGQTYWNGHKVSAAELDAQLAALPRCNGTTQITLNVAPSVPLSTANQVLNRITAQGLTARIGTLHATPQ